MGYVDVVEGYNKIIKKKRGGWRERRMGIGLY